ncbi:MAG: DinB family protein [Chloroflexota bacterium]
MRTGVVFAALMGLCVAPLAAQDIRASLADDFERQRANVLQMVEAMPEAGLRSAPTEGVRDFAQQIEHIVQGNVGIIGSGVDQPVAIGDHDAEVYLNSKEALAQYVNDGYDAIAEMVGSLSADNITEETSLFGQTMVERWKLAQLAYEHGVWTLGATVPYLRLQGATPPAYDLIPG